MNRHRTLPDGDKETPRRASVLPGVFVAGIMSSWILLLGIQTSRAGSATWQLLPGSGDWNDAANWTNATVPNGAADTATFNASTVTHISLSADAEVNGIVFNPGGNGFTITAGPASGLTVSGLGITNNSGLTQNFVIVGDIDGGLIEFTNSATAGIHTSFTTEGGNNLNHGFTIFSGFSTASSGVFITNGGNGGGGGTIEFNDNATAANGTFATNGGMVSGADGGLTVFSAFSTAGSGTFTTNGGAASGGHGGVTLFTELSDAGSGTFTANGGLVSGASAGFMGFSDNSSAGRGTFTVNGGTFSGADGATIRFYRTSTADTGTFTTNGGAVTGAGGGTTQFIDSSSARNGTFTTNGGAAFGAKGGSTQFANDSTAANATLIANGGLAGSDGGTIYFFDDSTGGAPTVKVYGNGNLDISHHHSGVSIGSLEGTGIVFLGGNDLTVGGNSLSTTFSGAIQDGGYGGGTAGGLIKTSGLGYGTLVLSGANTYTGATIVNNGVLQFAKRVSLYNAGSESWTKANIHVADGATVAFNVGGTGEFTNGDVTTLLHNLAVGINDNGLQAGSSIGFDTTNAVGGTFTLADLIADSTGTGSGSLGLTKLGDNTLILTAANTYTGATTVIAGRLEVNGSLASLLPMNVGSATLAGFGTFHSPTVVTSGAINGNGLTLTGLVTFNSTGNALGGTEIASSGVILAAGAVVTQSGTLTGNVWLTSGAGTSLTGSGTIGEVTMNGGGDAIAGNSTLTTAGLTINGNDNTLSSGTVIGNAIFGSGAAPSGNGASAGPATFGSGTALSVNGTLIGTATVGQGTLGGIGLVSGNVTVSGGTINFGNGGRIGGTLGVTGGSWTGGGSVTGLATSSSGAFTIGSGANLTASGDLSVTGGTIAADDGTSTITGSVSYTSGSSSNFGGVLAGGGKTLTLNNALAMLTLSGANTYTGPTTVTAGILAIDNDGITAFGTLGSGPTTVMGATANGGSLGTLQFKRNASALSSAVTIIGGTVSGASGGSAQFLDTSTAGRATLTNNGGTAAGAGGGLTQFDDDSSAGSATLIANGGTGGGNDGSIVFSQNSTGGMARVEVFANGNLDISPHNAPGVSIGSLEGTGKVFLGSKNLTVGTNNLSTTFSGVIQDGGIGGGTDGSLAKTGLGALILSGANTYPGTTNVSTGVLQFAKRISLYSAVSGSWTKANIRVTGGGTAAFNVGGTGEFTNGDVTTLLHNLTVDISNNGLQAGSAIGFDTTNTAVTGNTQTFTVADVIADSTGTGSGSLGLTKLGDNTLALTGANTYTGATTVNLGNLVVDNDGIATFGALGSGPTTILANDTGLEATLQFKHIASAGGRVITNNGGTAAFRGGGVTVFLNNSIAGSGAFTNNGGAAPFASGGATQFFNNSTAANGTFTNNGGAAVGAHGGSTVFYDASTASNGTVTTNGGTVSDAFGALLYFQGSSTAGNGIFTTNGGAVSGADGGATRFDNFSTAGSGTFTTNGAVAGAVGGITEFFNISSAGNATLIANGGFGGGEGGKILIAHDSTGGTARVEVFGNGNLDLSGHNAPGVSIGSLEGTGKVFLGSKNLTVGTNNLSTTFSGVIQDGGQYGGTGGLFTKTGTGTTTLSGDNTYTGDDTVSAGTLKFNIAVGAPAIGSGVTATVAAGATLELAGSVSALGTAGGNRVRVVNNSTASGVVVSGTSQVVGNIDGSGTTLVSAGSSLTADHIIQSALIIGGAAGNPGLVTIAASDASGNPLGESSGLALASSLTPSGPFGASGISSAILSTGAGGGTDLAALSLSKSLGGGNPSSVPEPSTLLLALLAVLGVVSTQFARHHFRRQTV